MIKRKLTTNFIFAHFNKLAITCMGTRNPKIARAVEVTNAPPVGVMVYNIKHATIFNLAGVPLGQSHSCTTPTQGYWPQQLKYLLIHTCGVGSIMPCTCAATHCVIPVPETRRS